MRKAISTYVTPTLASCLVLALAAGCGKKDKSDDAPAAAVDTSVTSTSIDGGNLQVKYKSTDPNAKFKCQLEVEGQPAEWQDCPADGAVVPVQPGVRYVFRVKAIGANGVEDAEPYAYAFTAGPGQGGDGTDGGLQTLILNKDEVSEIYDQTSLTLEFGIDGGPSTEDVRYECKRENQTTFGRCPSGNRYEFVALQDGFNYGLAVRAVLRDGEVVAQEDGVAFRVELNNIDIQGTDQLGKKSGTAQLAFNHGQATMFSCVIDQGQPQDCSQGMTVRFASLGSGNHTLTVEALANDQTVVASQVIPFCAISCGGPDSGPVQPAPSRMMVGAHYAVTVPEGLHVQQYSSDLNFNGAMDFYRIDVNTDPYAIGIDRCEGEFSRLEPMASARGDVFDYCHSNNPLVVHNYLLERRFANNHLQMATDPDLIESGSRHEVLLVSMFPELTESYYTESRFERLCRNGIGGVAISPPIALAEGFFQYDWLHAQFATCTVWMNNGPMQPLIPWTIGAFHIADRNQKLPCDACGYTGSKNLLEVVYMQQGERNAQLFTKDAQRMMLQGLVLESLRP